VSYTVPTPTPEPRQRPATVTLAAWLLYLTAAIWLASGIVAVMVTSDMTKVYERVLADDPNLGTEGAQGFAVVVTIISVAIAVVLGAGLITLGALIVRGKRVARIITWVLAGLGVCCSGYGIISTVASSSIGVGGGGVDAQEMRRAMEELLPSWYLPVSVGTSAVEIVALLVVIVLLALPASNAFFRQAQPPPWEPPVPTYPPIDLPPR